MEGAGIACATSLDALGATSLAVVYRAYARRAAVSLLAFVVFTVAARVRAVAVVSAERSAVSSLHAKQQVVVTVGAFKHAGGVKGSSCRTLVAAGLVVGSGWKRFRRSNRHAAFNGAEEFAYACVLVA